jgi:arylsulfatase A-like enzyme
MMRLIDAPIAKLVTDLEERGLLKRTLVVVASEFSRDMLLEGRPGELVKDQVVVPDVVTEEKHYGMHRHFSGASSVVVFGGGSRRGHVYGETADERPFTATKNPVTITDLHATFYTLMGIRPDHSYVHDERPVYVTQDGKGKPIADILS